MSKAIWMAGCLLLMVAPSARASTITINITEDSPSTITINEVSNVGTSLKKTLTATNPSTTGWTIRTDSDFSTGFTFLFSGSTSNAFYWAEQSPLLYNVVKITANNQISVMSDVTVQGTQPFFQSLGMSQTIGTDNTPAGNTISVVFNDSLTPDPADITPEPVSILLVGSGVGLAIACTVRKKGAALKGS